MSLGPSRRAKRRRVLELVGASSGVAISRLTRILDHIRKQPQVLEDVKNRHVVDRSLRDIRKEICPYVPLVAVPGQHVQDMPMLTLQKSMGYYLEHVANFRVLVQTCFAENPCTPARPWRLIVGQDELTPGGVLRLDNKRKTLAFFGSFREFGPTRLKHAAAWMPLFFVRSVVCKKVQGCMSAVNASVFREIFLGGVDPTTEGITLDNMHPDGSADVLFFNLGRMLNDEAAGKAATGAKGASGTMCCMECMNVSAVGARGIAAHDIENYIVDITAPDLSTCQRQTSEDIWEKCDILTELSTMISSSDLDEVEHIFWLEVHTSRPLFPIGRHKQLLQMTCKYYPDSSREWPPPSLFASSLQYFCTGSPA